MSLPERANRHSVPKPEETYRNVSSGRLLFLLDCFFELLSRGTLSLNPLVEPCRRKPGRLSSFQRPASLGLHSLSLPQHLSHAPHDLGWLIDDLFGQLLEYIAKVWVDLQFPLFRVGQDGFIFDSLLEGLA